VLPYASLAFARSLAASSASPQAQS